MYCQHLSSDQPLLEQTAGALASEGIEPIQVSCYYLRRDILRHNPRTVSGFSVLNIVRYKAYRARE